MSSDRLLRVGAAVAEQATAIRAKPIMRPLGWLVALALLVFLALRLWQLWRREPVDFGDLNGPVFAAAVCASVAAVSALGLVWPFLLRRLGTPAPSSWIGLFFKSQLGKYIPGSVWQYAGRVGMARSRGVPVQTALVSVTAELVYASLAAGAASGLILGTGAGAAIIGGVAALFALVLPLRRRVARMLARAGSLPGGVRLDRGTARAALRAAPAAASFYLVVWGLYGLALWTTGRALFAVPASDIPVYIGVFALAWLAGLVAVFAPGGIGVREAVIVALLSGRLGQADAIVLAATSRIVLTAVDLGAGAAALWLPLLRRGKPRPLGARR